MDSKTVIKALEADGWVRKAIKGSHHQFTHPTKKGKATVPHPRRDLDISVLRSIEKQAGISLRRGEHS